MFLKHRAVQIEHSFFNDHSENLHHVNKVTILLIKGSGCEYMEKRIISLCQKG